MWWFNTSLKSCLERQELSWLLDRSVSPGRWWRTPVTLKGIALDINTKMTSPTPLKSNYIMDRVVAIQKRCQLLRTLDICCSLQGVQRSPCRQASQSRWMVLHQGPKIIPLLIRGRVKRHFSYPDEHMPIESEQIFMSKFYKLWGPTYCLAHMQSSSAFWLSGLLELV